MEALGNWLKVLIVVVLLGNLVDFILPKGDLKRYGGLVIGLVVLGTMITPLWGMMHDLHHGIADVPTSWTNTPSGYSQVVSVEELHQACAIVLSMPGMTHCSMTQGDQNVVWARVAKTPKVSASQAHHYVKAALQVTMGSVPPLELSVKTKDSSRRAETP